MSKRLVPSGGGVSAFWLFGLGRLLGSSIMSISLDVDNTKWLWQMQSSHSFLVILGDAQGV